MTLSEAGGALTASCVVIIIIITKKDNSDYEALLIALSLSFII